MLDVLTQELIDVLAWLLDQHTSLAHGMRAVIRHFEGLVASPAWARARALDFEGGFEELATWLQTIQHPVWRMADLPIARFHVGHGDRSDPRYTLLLIYENTSFDEPTSMYWSKADEAGCERIPMLRSLFVEFGLSDDCAEQCVGYILSIAFVALALGQVLVLRDIAGALLKARTARRVELCFLAWDQPAEELRDPGSLRWAPQEATVYIGEARRARELVLN